MGPSAILEGLGFIDMPVPKPFLLLTWTWKNLTLSRGWDSVLTLLCFLFFTSSMRKQIDSNWTLKLTPYQESYTCLVLVIISCPNGQLLKHLYNHLLIPSLLFILGVFIWERRSLGSGHSTHSVGFRFLEGLQLINYKWSEIWKSSENGMTLGEENKHLCSKWAPQIADSSANSCCKNVCG